MVSNHHPNKVVGWIKFIIPSLLGIFLFLFPVRIRGVYGVPISFLARLSLTKINLYMPYILLSLFGITTLLTLFFSSLQPSHMSEGGWFQENFTVSWGWAVLRVVATLWSGLIFFKVGPSWLIGSQTGGVIFFDLLPTLWVNIVISSFFLPLLLEFGLLEFIGVLIEPIMRPLFRLPGRAAINCLVAWVGDGSVGSLMAIDEYHKKYYNDQEVSIVITSFSAVSITFCISMLAQVHLEEYFLHFYGTVILSSVVAALILPRVPPISWKNSNSSSTFKEATTTKGRWQRAVSSAQKKASEKSFKDLLSGSSLPKMGGMLISLLPSVMVIGGLSLVISHYTSFFSILGRPFMGILSKMGIPEATAVAKVLFIGFADMLIPALMIAEVVNPMTRFIVVCLAVSQLVYLSEIGALLMGSQVPLKLIDIFMIFLLRTIITLPIIVLCAHLIF